jgi:hypothetical protein
MKKVIASEFVAREPDKGGRGGGGVRAAPPRLAALIVLPVTLRKNQS